MKKIKLKDEVKAFLESISPEACGPTRIGKELGFDYARASSSVMSSLKALVAEGWAERLEKPVRYGKRCKCSGVKV